MESLRFAERQDVYGSDTLAWVLLKNDRPEEAAKAMAEGNRIGVPVSEDDAVKWMTINPAWALGLDAVTGSLERGKSADVVLWSGDPFSVYSRAEKVWVDGAMLFDRTDPSHQWRTDFELGFVPANRGGVQ